jgi:hypothetical protein
VPFVSEVAAGLNEVVTRSTASESGASTAEMAKTADVGAGAEAAAHMSAAEAAAQMSATTETSTVSTTEAPTMSASTSSAAARQRVSGQSPGESGSRCQDDHGFT